MTFSEKFIELYDKISPIKYSLFFSYGLIGGLSDGKINLENLTFFPMNLYLGIGPTLDIFSAIYKKKKKKEFFSLTKSERLAYCIDRSSLKEMQKTFDLESRIIGFRPNKSDEVSFSGNSMSYNGYFSLIELNLESGKDFKVFHKFTEKDEFRLISRLQKEMSSIFPFIPKSIELYNSEGFQSLGTFYEFVEGEILEASDLTFDKLKLIFDKLKQVYEFSKEEPDFGTSIKEKKTSEKTFERISFRETQLSRNNSRLEKFIELYKRERDKLSEEPKVLVHGDLHLNNVIFGEKQTHIIDWDNMHFSIPYYDFYHLSLLSDRCDLEGFEKDKKEFFEKQEEQFGVSEISNSNISLTEFDINFSLMDRYYIESMKSSDSMTRNKYIRAANKLYRKSLESLISFSEEEESKLLYTQFKKMTEQLYPELESDKEITDIALSEVHSMYQRRLQVLEEHTESNVFKHHNIIQRLVHESKNERHTYNIQVGIMSLSVAAYYYVINESLEKMNKGWEDVYELEPFAVYGPALIPAIWIGGRLMNNFIKHNLPNIIKKIAKIGN